MKDLFFKDIIDEYIKVLAYPKFKLSEKEINFILYHEILPYFEIITCEYRHTIIHADPSDDKFIHCAQSGKASAIISGDQHLLNLKSYGEIDSITPLGFLKEMGYILSEEVGKT